jgi:hypothetical protein
VAWPWIYTLTRGAAGLVTLRLCGDAPGTWRVRVRWPEGGHGRFGLVVVAYLHLRPRERAEVLHRAGGALSRGGTLLLVGHDVANLAEGVGGPPDLDVLYTPESIAAELDGLDIRRAERVSRPVETESGMREAVDTLVRAVRS